MLVATKGIGATGGLLTHSGFRDFLFDASRTTQTALRMALMKIRKAVRFEVKNGADVIKAAFSGGVLSLADEVEPPAVDAGLKMAALVDDRIAYARKWLCIVTATRRRTMRLRQASIRSARFFYETRNAHDDEKKGNISYAHTPWRRNGS